MKLYTKLVMMMLSLLIIAMLILFTMNQYSQNDLVQEIQESSHEVSKAIQLSIEDLTSEADFESPRLKEYLEQARNKGINEVNIIDNEGEIINSSDPKMIGKRQEINKLGKGLRASRKGKGASGSSLRPYDLLVPVIVGDEQLGYVQINLLLDNIQDIQHANFLRRLVATSMVFIFGIIITIFLARRYTEPIQRLAAGVKKVSDGDLSVTFPPGRNDEIGELAGNFNEMVGKLREREFLEKRLYEAEHLSKVGQLASGIAHEIRNPLNYISLAIDHLKTELLPTCGERSSELEAIAANIKEEVRKANYMVLNFMNYGRPLKVRRQAVVYLELIDRALPLLQDKLNEQRIEIVREIDSDLPPMLVDPELMRNCLFNFITNAAQAMNEGGTITLGAHYDAAIAAFQLTFADQGCGIGKEDIEKIFQPYYTTKEAGIGLGLAITERIIKEHGGELQVESVLGSGTTITVTLPMQRKD